MKKLGAFMTAASTLTLATAAFAQPTPDVDLGTLANPSTTTGALVGFSTTARVKWIKFSLAGDISNGLGTYLDIDLNGGTYSGADTQMGLYNNTGARVITDDDDGPGFYSGMSFGDTAPTRAGEAPTGNSGASTGTAHNGRDGSLAAGTYWLAVSAFSGTTFGTTGWGAANTTTTRTGDVNYKFVVGTDTTPTPPAVTLATINREGAPNGTNGSTFRLIGTGTRGAFPTSDATTTVTVDGTPLGLGPISLFDDGTHNDGAAGDFVFGSDCLTVDASATTGTKTLVATITDQVPRSATGSTTYAVVSPLAAFSCPTGSAPQTLADPACGNAMLSTQAVGTATNTVRTFTFGGSDAVASVAITGRAFKGQASGTFQNEMRFRLTPPGGSPIDVGPFAGTVGSSAWTYYDLASLTIPVSGGPSSGGTWTIESYESFDDATTSVDAYWSNVCIAYSAASNPTVTCAVAPTSVTASGTNTVVVTGVPTQGIPASAITGVTADFNAIDASIGTVTMFDDGAHGDGGNADGTWGTGNVTIPATATIGTNAIVVTATDALSRTGTCNTNLTVTIPPPANDDCSGAIDVSGQTLVNWDNSSATTSAPAWSCGAGGKDLWYAYTTAVAGSLDLSLCGSTGDTALSAYRSPCGTGALIACNDDSCGLQSDLPAFDMCDNETVYIRVGGYAGGTITAGVLNLAFTPSGAGANPSVSSITSSPACTDGDAGGAVTITARATPNLCSASPISSVTVNAVAVGDGAAVAMLDDGNPPDAAIDGVYTGVVNVAPGTAANNYSLTITATDAATQTATGNASVNVQTLGAQPDLRDSAFVTDANVVLYPGTNILSATLAADRVGLFKIHICDPSVFSATTVGQAGTIGDTQLSLFDSEGLGVTFDDDDPSGTGGLRSVITNTNVISRATCPTGVFYLAVAQYNRDATDAPTSACTAGNLIWANTPFGVERIPDGPGAANPLGSWTGSTPGGTIDILVDGTCGVTCYLDFDLNGVNDQDDIAYMVNAIASATNPTCFELDLNVDGNVDQDDVAYAVDKIASGVCP